MSLFQSIINHLENSTAHKSGGKAGFPGALVVSARRVFVQKQLCLIQFNSTVFTQRQIPTKSRLKAQCGRIKAGDSKVTAFPDVSSKADE